MIGFIYETTNLITNQKYIGKRQTNWGKHKIDEYLGSSKLLREDIIKYGKENFLREIIDTAETKEELAELEVKYLKDRDVVRKDDYYNKSIPRTAWWKDGWHQRSKQSPELIEKRASKMRGVKRDKYNMTVKFRNMTAERSAQIIELHEQGMTPWQIQSEIKYNAVSVGEFLKSKGFTPNKSRGKQLIWTKTQEEELIRLYKSGYSSTQLANHTGRTVTRITDKLKELNMSIRDSNWYKSNRNTDIIIE